jgi:sugar/nucleoside kinase (ribokinase family)
VSAVGNDASGSILLESLKKLGLNDSGVRVSDELATAVYSAVLDSSGDLDAAIADMRAFEAIVRRRLWNLPCSSAQSTDDVDGDACRYRRTAQSRTTLSIARSW